MFFTTVHPHAKMLPHSWEAPSDKQILFVFWCRRASFAGDFEGFILWERKKSEGKKSPHWGGGFRLDTSPLDYLLRIIEAEPACAVKRGGRPPGWSPLWAWRQDRHDCSRPVSHTHTHTHTHPLVLERLPSSLRENVSVLDSDILAEWVELKRNNKYESFKMSWPPWAHLLVLWHLVTPTQWSSGETAPLLVLCQSIARRTLNWCGKAVSLESDGGA